MIKAKNNLPNFIFIPNIFNSYLKIKAKSGTLSSSQSGAKKQKMKSSKNDFINSFRYVAIVNETIVTITLLSIRNSLNSVKSWI